MRGLLYKEWACLMAIYRKNLILVALLYGVLTFTLETDSALYTAVFLMGMYPLSGFHVDDQCGWGRYARTLPVSDRQIVGAKYLAGLLFLAICVAYALAVGVSYRLLGAEDPNWMGFLLPLALVTALGMVSMALMLMLATEFGPEKARVYMMVCWGVLALALFSSLLSGPSGRVELMSLLDGLTVRPALTAAVSLAVAGLLTWACYRGACARYADKEF